MRAAQVKESVKTELLQRREAAAQGYANHRAVDLLLEILLLLLPLLLLLLLLLGDFMPLRDIRVDASSTAAASLSATSEIARMRHGLLEECSVTTAPSRVTSVTSHSGRAPTLLLLGCRHTRVQSIPLVLMHSVRLPARASLLCRLITGMPLPQSSWATKALISCHCCSICSWHCMSSS
jgi:hypothetical protein